MTKGRVILLVAIVAVVALLAGGAYWYLTRYSQFRDLRRAQVAMQAAQFDNAAKAAAQHIADYPDDWRGYDLHARALINAGRYDEARKSLTEAIERFERSEKLKRSEKRSGFSLALAQTYYIPAGKSLGGAVVSAATIDQALKEFKTAEGILEASAEATIGSEAKAVLAARGDDVSAGAFAETKEGLSLLEAIAECRWRMSKLYEVLSNRLAEDAKIAHSVQQKGLGATVLASADALKASRRMQAEVKGLLLAVAREDPSSEAAMGPLVDLCTTQGDIVAVARLRRLLDAVGLEKISLIRWQAGMAEERVGNRLAEEARLARAAARRAEEEEDDVLAAARTAQAARKTKASTEALARADRARKEVADQLAVELAKAIGEAAQAAREAAKAGNDAEALKKAGEAVTKAAEAVKSAEEPVAMGKEEKVARAALKAARAALEAANAALEAANTGGDAKAVKTAAEAAKRAAEDVETAAKDVETAADPARENKARRAANAALDVANASFEAATVALDASKGNDDDTIKAAMAPFMLAREHKSAIGSLAELLTLRNDEATLTVIRGLIRYADDPAPLASTRLMLRDLAVLGSTADADTVEAKRVEVAGFLDDLLSRHQKLIPTLLARANLAVDMLDLPAAREHCDAMAPEKSDNPFVKLLHARLLGLEGHDAESIRELFSLTKKFPQWVQGHLAYARAVDRAGSDNEVRAMAAMRQIVRIDPGHAEALAFLATRLLSEGYHERALSDSRAYYEAHRDDPVAIRLYVGSLILTDQPLQAREVLKATREMYADRPEILIAAVNGHDELGEETEAKELAAKIAEIEPITPGARIAVARAMMRIGRGREAKALVIKGHARNPGQANLAYFLGEIHAANGDALDAMRQFRKAVKLSPNSAPYRIRLARAYLNSGDPIACNDTLRNVSMQNWQAQMLRLQASLLSGVESRGADTVLYRLEHSKRSGVPLAILYLQNGKVDDCIKVCQSELKKNRNVSQAHLLLGEAYSRLGEQDLAIHHLKQRINTSPDSLPAYQYLALALSRRKGPEKIVSEMLQIPGARADEVNLAMGWLLAKALRFGEAIERYGKVIDNKTASEYNRLSARLQRARARALTGDSALAALAIKELDELAKEERWEIVALRDKTIVLAELAEKDPVWADQAPQALAKVVKLAVRDENLSILRQAAGFYFRMKKPDDALAVCKEMRRIAPESPQPISMTAAVCRAAGRQKEALDWYRKAVDKQPDGIRVHLDLAMALDGAGQTQTALASLGDLEKLGSTARVVSIFEQGSLFARWGLHAKAAEQFTRLRDEGYQESPRIRLALGRAFAQLGKRTEALGELSEIKKSTLQYVTAQLLLADVVLFPEPGEENLSREKRDKLKESRRAESLAILAALAADKRGGGVVPVRQMTTMLQMDRAADALEVFETAAKAVGDSATIAGGAEALAMSAELQMGKYKAATDRAVRLYERGRTSQWRMVAAFLKVDDAPDDAAKMLDKVDRSGVLDTLVGLIVSSLRKDADATKTWHARLEKINKDLLEGPRKRGVPPEYMFLGALAAGDVDKARKIQATFSDTGAAMQDMARELVSSFSPTESPVEAARLLRAALALERMLPIQGRDWAMAVLKARPTCQWAAGIVFLRSRDEEVYNDVIKTLKPDGCLLAELMQGAVHMREGREEDYDKAAAIYARLSKNAPDKPDDLKNAPHYIAMIMAHAQALEMVGKYAEAIALYRKVHQANKDVGVANNIAYLTTQAYPGDKNQLSDARKLVTAALKVHPGDPTLLDTAGWVSHLLGDHDAAADDLRKVVKALPDIPEVHYHLGAALAAAGRNETAKWHLAAAVDLGEMMKQKDQPIGHGTKEAIRLARESLKNLP